MNRSLVMFILAWVLAACGQSGQVLPTATQAPIPSPSLASASPYPPTASIVAPLPTATIAVAVAPASPYPPPIPTIPEGIAPRPTTPSMLAGPEASGTISGTVGYPAELTLPPDASLTIQLLELRPKDHPLEILHQSITPLDPNQQQTVNTSSGMESIQETSGPTGPGPIPFAITYNPTLIDPQKEYVISAEVRHQGQLLFVTPWYPVLTQGHPATVEVMLEAQLILRGTVSYPAQPALPTDAVLTVRLVNQSLCGSFSCLILGEQTITPIEQSPTPFALAYNSAIIAPQWSYVVIAQISAPQGLNWWIEQPFPNLTQDQPTTVDLKVAPQPMATVTGTASYPAQPALPPDAVLTIELVNLTNTGVFGPAGVSKQTIPLDGQSPTPFTIDYDPAKIEPLHSYAVEARISAPGRLDWRTEQLSLVLTHGHPATVDIAVAPPPAVAAVSGTITYPAQPALPPDAMLTIQLANVKGADLTPLGEAHITPAGPGPISFILEYDPTRIDPQNEYVMYVMLRAGEQPPLITTRPYPVITQGYPTTVDAVLQAPATVTAVSGTIAYRTDQPLPSDARLVIEVEGFLGDDTSTRLGGQVIAPVGPGPIPFAITIDPASIAKQQIYRLDARIYASENVPLAMNTSQRVFAFVPVDVMLEPVR